MKNYTITVNGNVYDVVVEEGASSGAAPKAAPAAPKAAPKAAPQQQLLPRLRQQAAQGMSGLKQARQARCSSWKQA